MSLEGFLVESSNHRHITNLGYVLISWTNHRWSFTFLIFIIKFLVGSCTGYKLSRSIKKNIGSSTKEFRRRYEGIIDFVLIYFWYFHEHTLWALCCCRHWVSYYFWYICFSYQQMLLTLWTQSDYELTLKELITFHVCSQGSNWCEIHLYLVEYCLTCQLGVDSRTYATRFVRAM